MDAGSARDVFSVEASDMAPDVTPDAATLTTPSQPARAPTPIQRAALLRAERRLLSQAQAALAAGDLDRADELIAEHIARHGARTSQLGEERDARGIRIALARGDVREARARLARFTTRYPQSIFRDALSTAIDRIEKE